jgi:hypothetical protein
MRAISLFATLLGLVSGASVSGADAEGLRFFENEVRPVLVKHCYECHSEKAGKKKGGLLLDRQAGWQKGGDGGPAIKPGDLDASLLIHSIRYEDPDLQMPPKSRMEPETIAILERWVAMGAPDPRGAALGVEARTKEIDFHAARNYWAFRPLSEVAPPSTRNASWSRNAIDRFVLGRLEAKGLSPAPSADPRALIRRVHYDLTGLPPTPEVTEAFANEPTPEAFETLVNDLLAQPAFGEKWGRNWLDVARYADSNGGDRNFTFYQAWRYRNYVIDAFNQDKSYYQFVREQLAGDLMPWKTDTQRREQLVGSTFLALGPKMLTERDKEKLRLDTADEQIDTVGRAFLGLTLGCARCHDHKFDPVSQKDYYALAGIFRSTQVVMGTRNGCVNVASWVEQPLPQAEPQLAELTKTVARLELAMRLKVERAYMKKVGAKTTVNNIPLAGVIYDDTDAEKFGDWIASTNSANWFGPGYIHDDRAGKGAKRVVFQGSLPENGLYEVRIAYSSGKLRAQNVPITIEGWDKRQKVALDQTRPGSVGGLLEPVGRFRFEKGGRANVIIETTGTEGVVIVDAVQFISVKDIDRESQAIAMTMEASQTDKQLGGAAVASKPGGRNVPLAGVVLDDSDGTKVGAWTASTLNPNRYGPGYIHDNQKAKGDKRVIFEPKLPESGEYEVRVAYSHDKARASNIPITIEAGDRSQKVTLDQTRRGSVGGLLEPIGRFHFEKEGHARVIIETGGTEGYVIVDAVQFIPIRAIEGEAIAITRAKGEAPAVPLFRMTDGQLAKELTRLIKLLKDKDLAMAPRDADDAGDLHLRIRGEVGQLGPLVARNFPQALHDGPEPRLDEGQSGRLQLAEWITSPENVLLDRVMVNRIWGRLFGRGIVESVDNFGELGIAPTHPELLDYLAARFRSSNGSIKRMVREVVLSRAYQLGSQASPTLAKADPKNSLFGRRDIRRMTAEEIRDTLLFLPGKLDLTIGTATSSRFGEDLDKPMSFAKERLRTVYLPVARNNQVAELEVFDAANPDLVTGARATTTVPTQALYLLNSEFMIGQARAIVVRPDLRTGNTNDRIAALYTVILNRAANAAELARARRFVDDLQGEAKSTQATDAALGELAHVLLASTEFLYLD